jgi:1-pyrroline-5-carboxylate dehydrogenase
MLQAGNWSRSTNARERDTLHYIPLGVGAGHPAVELPPGDHRGDEQQGPIVAGSPSSLNRPAMHPISPGFTSNSLREAGLPDGVCNFLTGPGALAGETLVDSSQDALLAFTGSKEGGAGASTSGRPKSRPATPWIKRSILEWAGKDAVVVDETADLDAAAKGILVSAFGFQGQKCSAGSRAIIVADVYDALVEKIVAQAPQLLTIGDPDKREHYTGPVVSKNQYRTVLNYIEIGKGEGRLVYGGRTLERDGYFIEPAIFADVAPDARIAQEEIFGPVLALIKADDWKHAIDIANSTEFGLTGAYYSESRSASNTQKRILRRQPLQQPHCTGALVGIHPFGGFNMSGTDSKSGGPGLPAAVHAGQVHRREKF